MQKRNLTKRIICEAAIQLIQSCGLENLSMRKLASKLNVEAASLYKHINNKYNLLDLIQEYLYSQLSGNLSDKSWQEHLIELAINTRQGLLQTPNVVVLFATRPTITTSSLVQAEFTLNILIKSGFKPSKALSIYRNMHVFVLGHVLAEVGRVPGEADNNEEPSLGNMNIDRYPVLKKTSSYKSNIDFEKGFKLGIQCMINGLETLLMERRK